MNFCRLVGLIVVRSTFDCAHHLIVAFFFLVLDSVKFLRLLVAASVSRTRVQLQQPEICGVVLRIAAEGRIEQVRRLGIVTSLQADLTQLCKGVGLIGPQRKTFLQFGDRLFGVAILARNAAEGIMRIRGRLSVCNGLLQLRARLVVILGAKIGSS